MKPRMLIWLSLCLLLGVAAGAYIVFAVPRAPKPVAATVKFDRPQFPQLYNIREVTQIMRKRGVIDRFGYLSAAQRFSDPDKRKCFEQLAERGILATLWKRPSVTEFSGTDYLDGIQTLIALADLAEPYMRYEIGRGNREAARKPAMILSALALNYPHGTVGNLRILQKRCADLLLLADEIAPAAPKVKYAASI